MTRATGYIIFPAMTAALAIAAFGIYKDVAPKPKLTELPRFTNEHVHCAVYSDCTTLPHVHKPLAGWDEDRIANAQQPMTLYPKEWSAMAQGGIPHDCPRPTAKEDKEMCE